MHEVLPGIFEDSWEEIEKKIKIVAPFSKKIHIDLVDEAFAEKKNFLDPTLFSTYTKDLYFELHMMVKEPEQYLESWSNAGFRRFIGHVEHMSDQSSFVARAQTLGEVSLALDIESEIDAIKVDLVDLDSVLVMMCKAGASGQEFQSSALDKVRLLSQRDELLEIEVDGGISDKTMAKAHASGARRFVSTSYIFWGDEDPKMRYEQLMGVIRPSLAE